MPFQDKPKQTTAREVYGDDIDPWTRAEMFATRPDDEYPSDKDTSYSDDLDDFDPDLDYLSCSIEDILDWYEDSDYSNDDVYYGIEINELDEELDEELELDNL